MSGPEICISRKMHYFSQEEINLSKLFKEEGICSSDNFPVLFDGGLGLYYTIYPAFPFNCSFNTIYPYLSTFLLETPPY